MSWEDLESEIAELFAECSPPSIFDSARFAPKGMGCEWPGCRHLKPYGHGIHYCPQHQREAATREAERQRARQAARYAARPVAARCQRCVRHAAVAGLSVCVSCARDALRWRRREAA